MTSNSGSTIKDSVDGLPRQFISSLRILFDILDENRSGLVRLRDIESRWSDDGVRGLPPGVVDGLRKVTPPNGLLTFDRFVAGLKLVLTKKSDDIETRKPFLSKENRTPLQEFNAGERNHSREMTKQKFVHDTRYKLQNNSNREYDNSHVRGQRHSSYQPQGNPPKPVDQRHSDTQYDVFDGQRKSPPIHISKFGSSSHRDGPYNAYAIKPEVANYPSTVASHGPPGIPGNFKQTNNNNQLPYSWERERVPAVPSRNDRPPRISSYSPQMKKSLSGPDLVGHSHSPPAVPPRGEQSNKILTDLKMWQREWTANQSPDIYRHDMKAQAAKNPNHDNDIYANIEQFQRRPDEQQHQQQLKQQQQQNLGPQKTTVKRHGSGRRHTLANGIDQNMLKRMKQLEEETSMLRSGIAMVELAREWYMKQLTSVSDKQAMLGKATYNDNSVEAYQERINFQKARIAEINHHLQTLIKSSEKGFPLHMNLALSVATKPGGLVSDSSTMRGPKEQNSRLLDEINQKNEQISQMEKEKSSLVRELFESRSKHNKSNYDDTTFM